MILEGIVKMAITTPFRYTRMTFRMRKACNNFQRLMNRNLVSENRAWMTLTPGGLQLLPLFYPGSGPNPQAPDRLPLGIIIPTGPSAVDRDDEDHMQGDL